MENNKSTENFGKKKRDSWEIIDRYQLVMESLQSIITMTNASQKKNLHSIEKLEKRIDNIERIAISIENELIKKVEKIETKAEQVISGELILVD